MIIAGEASGDLHGAELVRELRNLAPGIHLYGIGGRRMEEAGFQTLFNCQQLAVYGIVEVASKLVGLAKIYLSVRRNLLSDPPDLLVLIDYPGFNLRLARAAKKAGVPVVYYICPQIWAWASGRVKKMARRTDRVLVILPFEKEFYQNAGVNAEYVGNPLVESLPLRFNREQAAASLGLNPAERIIGLLPGSRPAEVRRILPKMLEAANLLKDKLDRVQFLLPLAANLDIGIVDELVSQSQLPIKMIEGASGDAIALSDLVIVTSGTATLEAALLARPMVVVYEVSPVTYALGVRFVRLKEYSLANLVLGRRVVPELIQRRFTPENTFNEAYRILTDPGRYQSIMAELKRVRDILGEAKPSKRVAQIVWRMLQEN
jgi:lipid-A-disaccharide synthase